MKTGDIVRDEGGRTFQVGHLLGRGLWGKTFSARDEGDGSAWALKVSLSMADLPGQDEVLAVACRDIAQEQANLLEANRLPGLIPLASRFEFEGSLGMVLPLYRSSLEQILVAGSPLQEIFAVCLDITKILKGLSTNIAFHGNLTPSNIMMGERGEVVLTDPVTPAFRRYFSALRRAKGDMQSFRPPEVRSALGQVPIGVSTDTFAIAMMVYRAAMTIPGGSSTDGFSNLNAEGLDKQTVATLKDRVLNRLKTEHSNPRFHTRLSECLAAVLNRALSRETSPSPPYRFRVMDEFHRRLGTVLALVHPSITHVGRLIVNDRPGRGGFTTDEALTFSCHVACSTGVDNHDEIACGLALFDADRDERLRNINCSYTVARQPAGRFRFSFRVVDLSPGTYRMRVAFAIRESGEPPSTAEATCHVRPAPGYVPPRVDPQPAPIPLGRTGDASNRSESESMPSASGQDRNAGKRSGRRDWAGTPGTSEVVEGRFPRRRPAGLVRSAPEPTPGKISAAPTPIAPQAASPAQAIESGVAAVAAGSLHAQPMTRPDMTGPMGGTPTGPDDRQVALAAGTGAVARVLAGPGQRPAPMAEPRRLDGLQARRSSLSPATDVGHRPTPVARSRPTTTGAALDRNTASAPRSTSSGAQPDRKPVADNTPSSGRWSALPLPSPMGGEDIERRRTRKNRTEPKRKPEPVPLEDDGQDDAELSGPVGEFISQMVSMISGDAYIGVMAIAVVVILLLCGVLWALS